MYTNTHTQTKLFFDIETIPCKEEQKPVFTEIIKTRITKRNNSSETTVETDDEKIYHEMSLDGAFGRICCIGYIKEDGINISKEVLSGNEKDILTKFWQIARGVNLYIGHNIYDFDLPFIYKRSIVNNVKPIDLSFARYKHDPIFDTMKEWDKWAGGRISLDALAKVLNFPSSKDDIDGSQVWPYYKAGKLKEICEYCLRDVELERKIYYKMVFEPIPEEVKKFENVVKVDDGRVPF